MDIDHSAVEHLEGVQRCYDVLEIDETGIGAKAVHQDDDTCRAIGFVERAGAVYSYRFVDFIGVSEGNGSSIGECTGLLVNLALVP